MRFHRLLLAACVVSAAVLPACGAEPASEGVSSTTAAVSIKKSFTRKIYVHIMPWFQVGQSHWSMNSRNGATGVASWFAPMIGEYSSNDGNVIEYQLLTMKYAGIDGVLVDWPGLNGAYDRPQNKINSDAIINRTAAFGLEFGVCYEDQYADSLDAAKNDMAYVRDNFFSKPNHIKVGGVPALLVFGPKKFTNSGDWDSIFSVFPTKPMFFPIWYSPTFANKISATGTARGAFAWLADNGLKGVSDFDTGNDGVNSGQKIPVIYPGFNPYYAAGGWPGPTYKISFTLKPDGTEGGNTMSSTFELGKYAGDPLQIATWNDYGEGTMVEPTNQLQYQSLMALQKSVGTAYTDAELKIVKMLFDQRRATNGSQAAKLDMASAALANLDLTTACGILGCTVPVHAGTGGGGNGSAGATGGAGAPPAGGGAPGSAGAPPAGGGAPGKAGATGAGGAPPGGAGAPPAGGGAQATGGAGNRAGSPGSAGNPDDGEGMSGVGSCAVNAVGAQQRSSALLLAAGALAFAAGRRRRRNA